MKPRIFIVDDEAPARQRLSILLEDIRDDCPHELVGEAENAQAALDAMAVAKPDIVLMDVQMPGMTGIELAQHLIRHAGGAAPVFIFVTAYDQYALKAFEVHALDYLMKPVRGSRLAEAILRANTLLAGLRERGQVTSAASVAVRRQAFSVLERGRMLLVPVAEVLYLKAEQKYVNLHTRERTYLLEESLVSIEEEFADVFVRSHRNTLIARNAIMGVERASRVTQATTTTPDPELEQEKGGESWQVIVRNTGERLPISRRQWQAIKSLVR